MKTATWYLNVNQIPKHGFVDIKIMDDGVDNIGAYLIKYMTKDVSHEAFKGHKAYLCSKGFVEFGLFIRKNVKKGVFVKISYNFFGVFVVAMHCKYHYY